MDHGWCSCNIQIETVGFDCVGKRNGASIDDCISFFIFKTSEVYDLNCFEPALIKSLDILVNLCVIAHKVVIKSRKLQYIQQIKVDWEVVLAKEIACWGRSPLNISLDRSLLLGETNLCCWLDAALVKGLSETWCYQVNRSFLKMFTVGKKNLSVFPRNA